jgi:hypothetical protein
MAQVNLVAIGLLSFVNQALIGYSKIDIKRVKFYFLKAASFTFATKNCLKKQARVLNLSVL